MYKVKLLFQQLLHWTDRAGLWLHWLGHVKAYGEVPTKWVRFHQKSADKGPKSLEEGLISPKFKKKIVKSAVKFLRQKNLRNASTLQKFQKPAKSAIFEGKNP